MPTVRTISDNRIQTKVAPTQQIKYNPGLEAFGGGKTVTQLGNQIDSLGATVKKEYDSANKFRALDSDRQLSEFQEDYLNNPETGLMQRKGANAFTISKDYEENFAKKIQEIEDSLSNDDQKAEFKALASSRFMDGKKKINAHVSRETEIYVNASTKAYIDNEKNAAIDNAGDEERIGTALARINMALENRSDYQGMPVEQKKQLLLKEQSEVHKGVIERIIYGGKDREAKAYYEKYQDQIDGETKLAIDKSLKEGTLRGESQRTSDYIFSKSQSMSEALEKARDIRDPELRDETIKRIKTRFDEKKEAEKIDSETSYEAAFNLLDKNKTMDAIPVSLMSKLKPSEKMALEKRHKQLVTNENVATDPMVYNDLVTMASSPKTRNEFLKTSMLRYADKLSSTDLKKMIDWQGKMRGDDPVAKSEVSSEARKSDLIKTTLKSVGLDPSSDNKTTNKRINSFYVSMDEAVKAKQAGLGRKLNIQEFQETLDALVTEQVVGEKWLGLSDKTAMAFEALDEIPKADVAQIKAALKNNGIPDTAANVIYYYNKKQNK